MKSFRRGWGVALGAVVAAAMTIHCVGDEPVGASDAGQGSAGTSPDTSVAPDGA